MAIAPNQADDPPDDEETLPATDDPRRIVDYWLDQIDRAQKPIKAYQTRGRQIIKRYKNKRTLPQAGIPLAQRRMNVLWSNVQTLLPVLYAQTPKANVSRRIKSKDPVARVSAIVLQNCLQNSIAMEDFDHVMKQVLLDRLLPGMGTAIVEYVPQVEKDEIGWQAAETRYIHWEDVLTNPARTHEEVDWWAYRVFKTRKEAARIVVAGGGTPQQAMAVQRDIVLDHTEENKQRRPNDSTPSKAVIWVIWDKTSKQVFQIATGYPEAPLAMMPAPVNFEGFFPAPRPIQATTATDSTLPIPDFDEYADQADEIDMLTNRIGLLTKALRFRGVYAADMDSIKTLMENTGDGDLVPVSNFAALSERGGLEKAVLWMPIQAIAACLQECYEARDKAIEIMYEVTGISDIMRGNTEPSETASAQQLKAQFGGVRVRDDQKDVQRFIRDIIRRKAEIICEHFELPVIQAMSGVQLLTQQQKGMVQQAAGMWQQFGQAQQQYQQAAQQAQQQGAMLTAPPPQPPQVPQPTPDMIKALQEPAWEQVMGLLRNDKLRGFVVDVETDSTIEADQQGQQQAAVQYVTAVTEFLTAGAQISATPMGAKALPLMGELLSWATRQWKGADTIEETIDEFVEQIEGMANAPPQPDPKLQLEQVKGQVEIGTAKVNQQTAQIKGHADQVAAQAKLIQTVTEHHATMAEKQVDIAMANAGMSPSPMQQQPPTGPAD